MLAKTGCTSTSGSGRGASCRLATTSGFPPRSRGIRPKRDGQATPTADRITLFKGSPRLCFYLVLLYQSHVPFNVSQPCRRPRIP